jgi:hypothetical protein
LSLEIGIETFLLDASHAKKLLARILFTVFFTFLIFID